MSKQRYEVLVAGEWHKASKATAMASGWLDYEFRTSDGQGGFDTTRGLAKPSDWRPIGKGPKSMSELFKF